MSFTASLEDIVQRNQSGLLSAHPTWERVRLSDVARITNGFAFPSSRFSPDKGLPLLRIRDILGSTTEARFDGPYEDAYVVNTGDLVVGMDGDFNCALWQGSAALLNQRVCRLAPDERFYGRRLMSHVLSGYLAAINAETSAMTVKHLSSGTVADIPLPLPPITEQRRIVEKIEELFSMLDAGVAALERVRANLKRYRSSVLKAAVEGKLTEEWRAKHPDAEPASVLLERILQERRRQWEQDQLAKFADKGQQPPTGWQAKYRKPQPPDTSGLPELPEGWVWASVEQLAEVGTGTTPFRGASAYWSSGSIPWVASGAVNSPYITEPTDLVTLEAIQETTLRVYPVHTLVVALYGEGKTRGKASELLLAATINQALAALVMRGVADGCRRFLKTFLEHNYEAIRRKSSGGVQPNLNLGLVKAVAVPFPPLSEQTEIVAEVDRRLSVVDEIEADVSAGLKRATRLRQSILKRAFEGELVPQDPNDEPASLLLERIRADRHAERPGGRSVMRPKAATD